MTQWGFFFTWLDLIAPDALECSVPSDLLLRLYYCSLESHSFYIFLSNLTFANRAHDSRFNFLLYKKFQENDLNFNENILKTFLIWRGAVPQWGFFLLDLTWLYLTHCSAWFQVDWLVDTIGRDFITNPA